MYSSIVVGGGGGAWGGGGSPLQIRMGGNLQFIIIYRGVASKNISKGECGCRVTSTKFPKQPPPFPHTITMSCFLIEINDY